MKVLLVNGSPHKKGCTNAGLEEIASALNSQGVETEIFWIGAKPISGCVACGYCRGSNHCVIDTDTVNPFLDKARDADGFVFGSPVHFASASGAMTSFLDRVFYGKDASVFADKPAACIVSCRRGGATAAFDQLLKYPSIRNMPIVSSQYWNMIYGNTPEEVRQDAEGMQTMRTLGLNMAWLLKCIEAGKKAGISSPAREPGLCTNFIR